MTHRPVTLAHPPEPVNASNWKKYSVGITGDEVMRDGDFVRVPLVVMDAAAIDAIENQGVRELSQGYSAELNWGDGVTPDGQKYHAMQTNIRGNHTAFVSVARGGSKLTVDSMKKCPKCYQDCETDMTDCPSCKHKFGDALVQRDPEADRHLHKIMSPKSTPQQKRAAMGDLQSYLSTNFGEREGARRFTELTSGIQLDSVDSESNSKYKRAVRDGGNKGKRIMDTTVVFDGVPVEFTTDVGAAFMKNHVDKLNKLATDLQGKLSQEEANKEQAEEKKTRAETDAKATIDAKDGEIAALKKQLADAQITPEKLDALVKDRQAVIDAASRVLGRDAKFDGKTVGDIRRTAVAHKLGDATVKEMNDAAIEGAFKVYTTDSNATRTGTQALADSIALHNRRSNMGDHRATGDVKDIRDQALNDREAWLNNAWRHGTVNASKA